MNNLWLLTFFFIGYLIGRGKRPLTYLDDAKKTLTQAKDTISSFHKEEIKVGAIHRPGVEALQRKKQEPHVIESKQAMKASLDQIPELVKAKQKAEELKRKGIL